MSWLGIYNSDEFVEWRTFLLIIFFGRKPLLVSAIASTTADPATFL